MTASGAKTRPVIVAIDGPAGSGKSTVARTLAERLGAVHLDTGAVYRTLAVRALERGVGLDDEAGLAALADAIVLDLEHGCVVIDGRVPGTELRTREISIAASRSSVHPAVRARLVAKQRALLLRYGGVAEGRDIGTVVAPDATLKVFLTASPQERARRRAVDLEAAGEPVDLEALAAEIAERDERDAKRVVSPLKPADDALVIDTSDRSPEDLVVELIGILVSRGLAPEAPR